MSNRAGINSLLMQKRIEAESMLLELAAAGMLNGMTIAQVKDVLMGKEPESENGKGFAGVFKKFISLKDKPRTRGLYELTLFKLYAFCPSLDSLPYEEITKGWLTEFDVFMAGTVPSRNARNIHLRNIRAVFNYAIDEVWGV